MENQELNENITNKIINKINAAGIEVIIDKDEFDRNYAVSSKTDYSL